MRRTDASARPCVLKKWPWTERLSDGASENMRPDGRTWQYVTFPFIYISLNDLSKLTTRLDMFLWKEKNKKPCYNSWYMCRYARPDLLQYRTLLSYHTVYFPKRTCYYTGIIFAISRTINYDIVKVSSHRPLKLHTRCVDVFSIKSISLFSTNLGVFLTVWQKIENFSRFKHEMLAFEGRKKDFTHRTCIGSQWHLFDIKD